MTAVSCEDMSKVHINSMITGMFGQLCVFTIYLLYYAFTIYLGLLNLERPACRLILCWMRKYSYIYLLDHNGTSTDLRKTTCIGAKVVGPLGPSAIESRSNRNQWNETIACKLNLGCTLSINQTELDCLYVLKNYF